MLNAIWLSTITITTVGYGDIYACTVPGRIVTLVVALSGVFIMALVVGVVS